MFTIFKKLENEIWSLKQFDIINWVVFISSQYR